MVRDVDITETKNFLVATIGGCNICPRYYPKDMSKKEIKKDYREWLES